MPDRASKSLKPHQSRIKSRNPPAFPVYQPLPYRSGMNLPVILPTQFWISSAAKRSPGCARSGPTISIGVMAAKHMQNSDIISSAFLC